MTVARLVLGMLAIDVACLAALGALLLFTERGHAAQPPTICVSAIGPVDSHGHGDNTPDLECHPIGANP